MWHSDLEHTKERPLHKLSQDQSKSTALGGVWNFCGTVHYRWQFGQRVLEERCNADFPMIVEIVLKY